MGDQAVRLLDNLVRYQGAVCMVTLTAPGREILPWDRTKCTHEPGVTCSGLLGCVVEASAGRAFNEAAMRRWSSLWDSVRVDCHRKFGAGTVKLLAYAPETQRRGVLHYHVVLGAGNRRERACLRYAARLLAKRADAHGWGKVDDGPAYRQLGHAAQAAVYLSKYLVKVDADGSLRELVLAGEAPRRAVYVSRTLTRVSRCTMRNLRGRRYAYKLSGRRMTCAESERFLLMQRMASCLGTLHGVTARESARLGLPSP